MHTTRVSFLSKLFSPIKPSTLVYHLFTMSKRVSNSSSFEKVLESPFSIKEMYKSGRNGISKLPHTKAKQSGRKKLKRKKKSHKATATSHGQISRKSSFVSTISSSGDVPAHRPTLLAKIDSPHLNTSNVVHRKKRNSTTTIQAIMQRNKPLQTAFMTPAISSVGSKELLTNPSSSSTSVLSYKSEKVAVGTKLSHNYSSTLNGRLTASTKSITRDPFCLRRIGTTSSVNYNCFSIHDLARGLKQMMFKKIVIMAGAGISTASGIPDFRTPGTGLYDNLQQYHIPEPSAIFDITFFVRNPRPFFTLAKELYPGKYPPNIAHHFIRLLQDKGILLRHYTQNIDGLERLAGIKPGRLVESHGSFATASCTVCQSKHDPQVTKELIFQNKIPHCKHKFCKGIVKPDIVFFGEDLPHRFHTLRYSDLSECDLLIVMGTSLEVEPFASLVTSTKYDVPRILVNREVVDPFKHQRGRAKDLALTGDICDKVTELARLAGWTEQLNELVVSFKDERKISSGSNDKDVVSPADTIDSGCGGLKTKDQSRTAQSTCSVAASKAVSPTSSESTDIVISDISRLTIIDDKN